MAPAVARLHHVEHRQLGQDERQQTTALQVDEAAARVVGHHYFIEFLRDALTTNDLDALGIARERLKCLILNIELQLRGKAHTAHHAQRIVAEGHVGVEWRADDAILQVVDAVEGVNEFTEAVAVETHREGVDGEVATVLVVFQRTVLDMRLTAVAVVALTPGAHKLHLLVVPLHLRRSEVAEHREVSRSAKRILESLRHLNATANHHHINIVARTLKEEVAHIATHHIRLQMQTVGGGRYLVENVFIEKLRQFGVTKHTHRYVRLLNHNFNAKLAKKIGIYHEK